MNYYRIVLPAPLDTDRFSFTGYAEEFLQNKQVEFTKVCYFIPLRSLLLELIKITKK